MKKEKKIVIIGGGPTGLGAAWKLHELGYTNWMMFEKKPYFGGHSTTHTDPQGFKWDEGGHVLFSHYPYFDNFVKKVLTKDFYAHERESHILLPGAKVPYPFQNNVRHLKPEDQTFCLGGLAQVQGQKKKAKNFYEWINLTFGEGIAEVFMLPYNFRVWATPLKKMSHKWIEERVSVPDFQRALKNVLCGIDDVAWGPNNTFLFPKTGGTGEMYKRAGKLLEKNIVTNKEVVGISIKKKELVFSDGEKESYDFLISSVPLTEFVNYADDIQPSIKKAALSLTYNSIVIVGLGIKKPMSTSKGWEYYPDPAVPFNRLTYFHSYSPDLVPDGDVSKYSSLMLEVCYSKYKKINKETVVEDSINALIAYGIINESDRKKIVSKTEYDIKYGYPIPTLDRDGLLKKIQPYLMKNNVYSRGRYGAWKYEISNMDHCFMQGAESVEAILHNKKEETWIP